MTTDQPATIAGFGFDTDSAAPDLSDLDEVLARIAATGATHAELSLCNHELVAGGRILAERRRKLERICARHPLAYTAHGTLVVNFMDEAHLDLHKAVCRSMLELCDAVGASVMVQHPGIVPVRPASVLERLHGVERGALREMGDVAARYGVRIALETLFIEDAQHYTADPVRLARAIAAIDHPQVCGTLDFSHAYIMTSFRGMDYLEALRAFAPYTNHLHVHELVRPPDHHGALRLAGRAHRLRHGRPAFADGLGRHPLGDDPAAARDPARHRDDRRAATPPPGRAGKLRRDRARFRRARERCPARGGLALEDDCSAIRAVAAASRRLFADFVSTRRVSLGLLATV